MKNITLPKLAFGKKAAAADAASSLAAADSSKATTPAPSAPPEKPAKEKTLKEKKVKEPKAPKAAKTPKAKSDGKKQRFVFILGDEGAILVFAEGKTVLKRLFAANADPENSGAMQQLLEANPSVPIYALVDMMDQSYNKQTLPPVTKLSIGKLIRRRLERDYAPEDITGALPLGRETTGRKDWNIMLISVAGSPQLMQWVDFILSFNNAFEGVYLVPIESLGFVQELSRTSLGKNASPWQLLVCHNKVGGFRQVIFNQGKLTFTRLAQPIGDTSSEVIAGSVEQEISNTIEYLKRLSYKEEEGLDCFIVISSEIKKHIDPRKIKAVNTQIYSPFEASEALGLNKAAQPEDHYADVVFSTFFVQNAKKILPLHTKFSAVLDGYRKRAIIGVIASGIVTSLLLLFAGVNTMDILPRMEKTEMLETQIRGMGNLIADANSKVATLPKEIDRMEDIIGMRDIFNVENPQVFHFIKTFRTAAQGVVVVKKLSWKDDAKIDDVFAKLPPKVIIDLDVEFVDSTGTVDAFAQKAKAFFSRTKAAFPELTMTTSKLPSIIDQEQAFRAEFKQDENQQSKDMMTGEPIVVSLKFITAVPDPNGVVP